MQGHDKQKNLVVAYALWLMVGEFGAHRFYTGHKRTGLLQLALFAMALFLSNKIFYVVGGWWIVDLFLVPSLCRTPINTQDQKEENDFQTVKSLMFEALQTAKSLMLEAKLMYERDEFDAADQLLQAAAPLLEHQTDLESKLFFAQLLNSRGLIKEKLEQFDEAEGFFRQSITAYEQNTSRQIDDHLITVHRNLAHVFLTRQQPERAKEMLEQIFRQPHRFPPSNITIRAFEAYTADCLMKLKAWELARTYYEQMIALLEHSHEMSDKGHRVDYLSDLGEIALAQKQFSLAIQHLKKAEMLWHEMELQKAEHPNLSSIWQFTATIRVEKISNLYRRIADEGTEALLIIRQYALHDLLEVICWKDTTDIEAAYEQLVGQLKLHGQSPSEPFDHNDFAMEIRSTLSETGHILHFDHNEGVELILQGIQYYAREHGIGGRLLNTSYESFDEEDEDYPIPFFNSVNDMMAEQGFELWTFFLFDDSFTIFFTRKEETEAKKLKIAAYHLGFTEENNVLIYQG